MTPDEPRRLAVLTQEEWDNPVVAALLAAQGWADADRLSVEDLPRPNAIATQPVNRPLWQPFAAWEAAEGYDEVLVTFYRGMGYYLLQTRPETVTVLPTRSMIRDKLIGAVVHEGELVGIELEESVWRDHRDALAPVPEGIIAALSHKIDADTQRQDLSAFDTPAETLVGGFFVFLPHPRMGKPLCGKDRGLRLGADEYLAWMAGGQVAGENGTAGTLPRRVTDAAEGRPLIVVDEGYDYLGAVPRAVADGTAALSMLAYDQRKPQSPDPGRQVPAIRSRRYWGELISAAATDRFIGYGDPRAYTRTIDTRDAVAVSIVVVYHNRPKYLGDLLDAFAAQTETRFEIIIVDNGSREELSLPGGWPFGLRVMRNMNAYPGLARNLGAAMAQGEYLIFFDDDNLPKPDFVAELLAAGQSGRFDLTLCFRDLFVTQNGGEVVSRGFSLSAPDLRYSSFHRNYIGDNVFIMRRSVFESLEYTDFFEVGREDIEFLQYARDSGLKVGILPKPLYLYRLANADKIGNKHLTHRTTGDTPLDYGAYRKYFRSAGSFAERKHRQLVDIAMVSGFAAMPGADIPQSGAAAGGTPGNSSGRGRARRRRGRLVGALRRRASQVGWIRWVYFRVFR